MEPYRSELSKRNVKVAIGCCVLVAVGTVLAIVLTLTLSGENETDRYPGQWVKTFPNLQDFDDYDDIRNVEGIHQIYVTGQNDTRLFISKQPERFNTSLIEILDRQDASRIIPNKNTPRDSFQGPWMKTSEIQAGLDIPQSEIVFMVPTKDGTRLAISDSESRVAVYEESSTNHTWHQVGQTLSENSLPDTVVDPSLVSMFGRHAMALSNNRLTIAAGASDDVYDKEESLLEQNRVFVISSFVEKNGSWEFESTQNDVLDVVLSDAKPVFADSGRVVAFPRAAQVKGEWKQVVDLYTNPPTSSTWTLASTLVEPTPPADDAPPMTSFGLDTESISFSHNGDVCAIGAMNFKEGDHSYGRVEVYHANQGETKYTQKGQVIKADSSVFRLGSLVSLSNDGNRLALYYLHDGDPRIQVYQYDEGGNKWRPLGNEINSIDPSISAEQLSFTGSRIAIAWNCDSSDLFCFSIYELQEEMS